MGSRKRENLSLEGRKKKLVVKKAVRAMTTKNSNNRIPPKGRVATKAIRSMSFYLKTLRIIIIA